ncbi:hypothetical protein D0Z07_4674 [Hyphodiscus hymeniophilus]|uniref:Uncharacterized protein n=1 Tax=Hyphodiscus hymeniophilus TaxID=353542 RepID=A0A9P7AX82_9HELO|nr:hypothetical protein D0Z07_4674 [Hyphodiscus hymeniophilus]
MAGNWFPVGKGGENGWRLDIVSLLAVIGESSMESHSQALTSSWTCILPRIIPAPQALLKATRPSRLRLIWRLSTTQCRGGWSTQWTGCESRQAQTTCPIEDILPLNVLSVFSCLLTIGLLVWAALIQDGTAILALGTISLASSIVGYASWWSPELMSRTFRGRVPPGDMVIRTREGAFLLIRCNEDVARELYIGTEECVYKVRTQRYRVLVASGTFLLMVSVVLLGNCNFTMQAAIGVSYVVLNGLFWISALVEKRHFWDLSSYEWQDVTPDDAKNADIKQDDSPGGHASFTRTMWYAIRETKKTGWVSRGGAAPRTPQWEEWLEAAERNAKDNIRNWNAVAERERIVGQAESVPQAKAATRRDTAEQHVPAVEVPPQLRV